MEVREGEVISGDFCAADPDDSRGGLGEKWRAEERKERVDEEIVAEYIGAKHAAEDWLVCEGGLWRGKQTGGSQLE